MADRDVHRQAKAPVIPEDGRFPYWETMCGKRLDKEALGITSNPKDVTCAKCKGKK
jgi:hypothetical protein